MSWVIALRQFLRDGAQDDRVLAEQIPRTGRLEHVEAFNREAYALVSCTARKFSRMKRYECSSTK